MKQVGDLWMGHARDPTKMEFEPPRRQGIESNNSKCKTCNAKYKIEDALFPGENALHAGVVKRDFSLRAPAFRFAF
jgi:hypothetical protein